MAGTGPDPKNKIQAFRVRAKELFAKSFLALSQADRLTVAQHWATDPFYQYVDPAIELELYKEFEHENIPMFDQKIGIILGNSGNWLPKTFMNEMLDEAAKNALTIAGKYTFNPLLSQREVWPPLPLPEPEQKYDFNKGPLFK